jgi:hypothetical protein
MLINLNFGKIKKNFTVIILVLILFTINSYANILTKEQKQKFSIFFSPKEITEIENIILNFKKLGELQTQLSNYSFVTEKNQEIIDLEKQYQNLEKKSLDALIKKENKINQFLTKTEKYKYSLLRDTYLSVVNNEKLNPIIREQKGKEIKNKIKSIQQKLDSVYEINKILFELTRTHIGARIIEGTLTDNGLKFEYKPQSLNSEKSIKKKYNQLKKIFAIKFILKSFVNSIPLIVLIYVIVTLIFFFMNKKNVQKKIKTFLFSFVFTIIFFMALHIFNYSINSIFKIGIMINRYLIVVELIFSLYYIYKINHFFTKKFNSSN